MTPNVLYDCDFSADVGDLGALALLAAYHRLGHVNIIGAMCCVSAAKTPGAIDATLRWWGVNGIPVGTWKGAAFDPDGSNGGWRNYLYDNYTRTVGLASTVPDAKTEQRRILAAQPDGSVTMIAVGPLNTVNELLTSTADAHSALTGSQLVAAKVRDLWIMGGRYPTNATPEWNLQQAPADAANVASNWPTPIYWVGYEVGGTFTVGGSPVFSGKATNDLMRQGYANASFGASGREAWDEMTVMACAQRASDFTLTRGTNAVNASTGANTFTPSASGNHYYVMKAQADSWYQARINRLIGADVTATPIISSWGTAPGFLRVGAA